MKKVNVEVRNTRSSDFPEIIKLSRKIYPESTPWNEDQLAAHLRIFPEGQFVAEELNTNQIIGTSASLIIFWDDYHIDANWRHFTDTGFFTNHDPKNGRTLYGADVMVNPDFQGCGIGSKIYAARSQLAESLGLLRIRAGARLRGFYQYVNKMSPEDYTLMVIKEQIYDPTLTFQLHRGFRVIAVVENYIRNDAESLGYAAIIEWLNPKIKKPEDTSGIDIHFSPGGSG